MSRVLIPVLLGAAVSIGSAHAQNNQLPTLQEEAPRQPTLVTFGPKADPGEGDHDFQQIIRIELPAAAKPMRLKIFDPDVGGAFDEPQKGFNSRTRFSLFGNGTTVSLARDDGGIVSETLTGEALNRADFGYNEDLDAKWFDLFELDPAQAALVDGQLTFYLLVEGIAGNDGNVFDVNVTTDQATETPAEGVRMFTSVPTFQVPSDPDVRVEYRFRVPRMAKLLNIETFDAAGAGVFYEGQFRFKALKSSERSQWQQDKVILFERNGAFNAAITTSAGDESPNDLTVFVEAETVDGSIKPLALELPPRFFRPKRRPQLAYQVTQLGCRQVGFDSRMSSDADGDELSHRWRPSRDGHWRIGPQLTHTYQTPGVYFARLEAFNSSRRIGAGSAANIRVVAKDRPNAVINAPRQVPEDTSGTVVLFDASASRAAEFPRNNMLTSMIWSFGDGNTLTQTADDPDFGKVAHRFAGPGTYQVSLTVIDDPEHPCNQHQASHQVMINGQPTAEAGGNREGIAGRVMRFDGRKSADAEGPLVAFAWDFGDGGTASAPVMDHTFHTPGQYQVSLTVQDNDARAPLRAIDTVTVNIGPADNQSPLADAGADRQAIVGQPVPFDATASRDIDDNLLAYRWDFGDGQSAVIPQVAHTFWAPGQYTVNLQVEDSRGGTAGISTDTAIITVRDRPVVAPTLDFAQNIEATAFVSVRFDASAATDADGSIVEYHWDFGDGTTAIGQQLDHQYSAAGTYQGYLTLRDDNAPNPAETILPFEVTVRYADNLIPAPEIDAPVTALSRELLQFDASASDDPDGSILTYMWTFGDGHRASGMRTQHAYQFAGSYDVTLTVGDDDPRTPATRTASHTITVSDPENQQPQADAGAAVMAQVGRIVQFDGRNSSDPDGNILAYFWEFGDGSRSHQASPQHTFHDPGDYLVRLTVTDDGSPAKTASTLLAVSVRAAQ